MSELQIKYMPVAELTPYANNSRTHSDEQVLQIAASINEFGFTNPILIDEDGGVIAGHGRIMAADKLELAEVPTITLAGLTEAQKKAYVIADNQLALNSGWDFDMLKIELRELDDLDFDLDLIGFDPDVIDRLLDDSEYDDEDEGSGQGESDEAIFEKKTFNLHVEQIQSIEDALEKAKFNPAINTGMNDSSDANALVWICEHFLKEG